MFKTLAKWIGAIPWWLLLIGGPLLMVLVGVQTSHVQTHRLIDSANTPEMKAAIRQEIKRAEEQAALDFGKATIIRIQGVSSAPDLKAELDQALEDIKQAQAELDQARRDAAAEVEQVTREVGKASEAQIKEAEAAAQEAVKNAEEQVTTARQALKEALKGATATQAESNATGKVTGDGKRGIAIDIDLSDASDVAKPSATGEASNPESGRGIGIIKKPGEPLQIGIGVPDAPSVPGAPLPPLPPELKAEIGSQVQSDIRRVLIGSTTILVLLLLFITLVVAKSVVSVNRALKARAARSEKEAQQASLSKQLMQAKLAAMQAQIEPHFLFNTLASVDHLIETDPPAASKMQKNLIAYLRAAIPQMRESSTTLAREAEMCRAYLNILQVRMESRLRFDIAIPDELKDVPIPPMMLPTLTENAIKHGLEPKLEGGEIRITAARAGGKLRVSVADSGMGFSEQPGTGVGLTNIRECLQALYGTGAELIIEPNVPIGTIATIEIPYPNAKGPDRR